MVSGLPVLNAARIVKFSKKCRLYIVVREYTLPSSTPATNCVTFGNFERRVSTKYEFGVAKLHEINTELQNCLELMDPLVMGGGGWLKHGPDFDHSIERVFSPLTLLPSKSIEVPMSRTWFSCCIRVLIELCTVRRSWSDYR